MSELTRVKTWRDTIHKEMIAMSKEEPQDFCMNPASYHGISSKIGQSISAEAVRAAERNLAELKEVQRTKLASDGGAGLPRTAADELGFLADAGFEMNSPEFRAIRKRCGEVKFSEVYVAATGRTPSQRDTSARGASGGTAAGSS